MENKKAMSDVVTTLIIILLAIVALGIIWMVVKGILQGGAEQVNWASKCREVEIQAVKINETTTPGNYLVTLSRTSAGDKIAGVKLVFGNGITYSNVTEFGIAIDKLETKTNGSVVGGIADATEVQMTPYFIDDLGAEHLCQTVTEEI